MRIGTDQLLDEILVTSEAIYQLLEVAVIRSATEAASQKSDQRPPTFGLANSDSQPA